jgi:hypothetical protein
MILSKKLFSTLLIPLLIIIYFILLINANNSSHALNAFQTIKEIFYLPIILPLVSILGVISFSEKIARRFSFVIGLIATIVLPLLIDEILGSTGLTYYILGPIFFLLTILAFFISQK